MASKELNVVATLYPKKGKTDEVIQLLHQISKYVQENEPFVLRYEINRSLRPDKNGEEEIVMLERYADQEGLRTHGSSKEFTSFQKKLEERGLMRAPMLLKMVWTKGGFSSRL